jgi:hypothetical protein
MSHPLAAVFRVCPAAILVVALAGAAHAQDAPKPLSFSLDVLPLLSKHSCNSGGCHGKAIGQNGFKLSLYGFDPAADYNALVYEGRGRRVSPAAPEDSLLLRKASGSMAHGGGVRLAADSQAYQLLKRWIEEGLPFGEANEPVETKLEVAPAAIVASGKSQQQLSVIVHYSDGSTRDVTTTARYDAQQPELLAVSELGLVETSDKPGEGSVMIRYGNLVASARVTQPLGQELGEDAYAGFVPKNFIDQLVLQKWKSLHIAPSPEASDEDFLRRVMIDVLGTLPTPQEVR